MESSRPLRVLEFYSGIGGMRYALEKAGVFAKVVEAFEINDMANDVYEYNFHHRPYQGNINHLTQQELDGYEADVWLLSPPCQPYTRQGLQKDAKDARASSFLKLLEMLPVLLSPPMFLFVENVVGFESSGSHDILVDSLKKMQFVIQEFILTPLQLGIPNSRPRIFFLAKRRPLGFLYSEFDDQLLHNLGPSAPSFSLLLDQLSHAPQCTRSFLKHEKEWDIPCKTIKEYLEDYLLNEERVENGPANETYIITMEEQSQRDKFEVPEYLIDRWGDAFDVVTPNSRRCCCFTKSYGRFVKGTGSFIATKLTDEQELQLNVEGDGGKNNLCLKQLGLRYFTPQEIANLHSFPESFKFPDHITTKQRYALLGNSLSVAVAASLLQYLFSHNC